jgi:hypothetical protein
MSQSFCRFKKSAESKEGAIIGIRFFLQDKKTVLLVR